MKLLIATLIATLITTSILSTSMAGPIHCLHERSTSRLYCD
jgi:hypothetical protein